MIYNIIIIFLIIGKTLFSNMLRLANKLFKVLYLDGFVIIFFHLNNLESNNIINKPSLCLQY